MTLKSLCGRLLLIVVVTGWMPPSFVEAQVGLTPAHVKEVMVKEEFSQPFLVRKSDFLAIALTDNAVQYVWGSPLGIITYREEGDKGAGLQSWVITTNTTTSQGQLSISAGNTDNNEGVEIYFGDGLITTTTAGGWHQARYWKTACIEANITIGAIIGTDQLLVGWRKNEAFQDAAAYQGYADWSVIGVNDKTGSIVSLGEVAGGGTLSDDTGVNWANGETRTLKSCITATTGVPTASYTAASGTTYTAITMDNSGTAKTSGIFMNPFISYLHSDDVADSAIKINWIHITRP
jgi:hypothetical protein